MNVVEIRISHLRNILSARLALHPKLNIISGKNGSGKTSFLEALYLLSSGHSFRTREIHSLINHQQDTLTVFAELDNNHRISIQKTEYAPTEARLNGQNCSARSELAAFLPAQVFYQDIFQLIDAGPKIRRSLLDWGLFHVEHSYHALWREYQHTLKQRNTLLRQKKSAKHFQPWDQLLAELAQKLDAYRSAYCHRLSLAFEKILNQLSLLNCSLRYDKGWDKKKEGKSLTEVLQSTLESDFLRQYTHYGPHHADLMVVCEDALARQYFSRGQQKMILFALKFAQAELVYKDCIFLIDDLNSELDADHVQRLMTYCKTLTGQIFITARGAQEAWMREISEPYKHFHLENGVFTCPGS